MKKIALIFIALSFFATAQAEETLYIHANTAKLMSEPSFKSDVVKILARGEAITLVEKNKKWIKIRHNNNIGWLSKLLVKNQPPLNKTSLLSNRDSDLSESSRRRASTHTTTAAARGLRQDGRVRESDTNNANFDALSEMEENKVSDHDAIEFLKLNNKL